MIYEKGDQNRRILKRVFRMDAGLLAPGIGFSFLSVLITPFGAALVGKFATRNSEISITLTRSRLELGACSD